MRVILFGYYGFGNAGDEAILAGLLHALRRTGPDGAQYVVLSGNPAETERLHGVRALPRDRWRTLLGAARAQDRWVFGGGSLLQNVTGPFTLPYYLGVLTLLARRRVPFYVHAHGIGPVNGRLARRLTASAVAQAERISVRDAASAAALAAFGVPAGRIRLGADPALLLEPPRPAAPEGEGPLVGVALRPWRDGRRWVPEVIRAVRGFAERVSARVLAVPMDEPGDRELAARVAAALPGRAEVAEPGASFAEKWALLGQCDLVLAMRLHAAVFAAAAGVPFVTLAYDPKVAAFAGLTAAECIPLAALTAGAVREGLERAWAVRAESRQHLAAAVASLRRLAEQDTAELAEALFGVGVRERVAP